MFPKLPNPAWPDEICHAFNEEVNLTKLGCGRCCNAEWCSESRNEKTYFVVAMCRAGVPIENGEAKMYCTAYMSQPSAIQTQPALGASTTLMSQATRPAIEGPKRSI